VGLFDRRFLHAGPNSAVCCQCSCVVDLGDPLQVGSLFAIAHRIICDAAANPYSANL